MTINKNNFCHGEGDRGLHGIIAVTILPANRKMGLPTFMGFSLYHTHNSEHPQAWQVQLVQQSDN